MKIRRISIVLSAVVALALIVKPAGAQLPGGLGGAAKAANANRVQAQAQQRVQVQVQQRVAAQAQARVQAEAARAAHIAQQAAAMAQRQAAAARQRANGGINVRVGADARAGSQARVANQSANANAHARLGIQAGLVLPPGLTKADVKIYDNIFGRFNPLRPQPVPQQPATPTRTRPNANSAPAEDTANNDSPRNRRPGAEPILGARSDLDFTARVAVAARQRRAEISEMRDHALATANSQLLLQAERTEETMNAFVQAQARARAEAEGATARRPNIAPPRGPNVQGQGQANGTANGTVNPRTAKRPGASANGSGNAGANGGVKR